jgi:hypothetical protein
MKSGEYQPIPTPSAQRWREARAIVLPLMVFMGAVLVVGFLWQDRIGVVTMTDSVDGVEGNVAIVDDNPMRLVGYLRHSSGIEPRPGDQVQIRTRSRGRAIGMAQILEVGLQFEALPHSLQTSLKLAGMETALPVNISLPAGLELYPGELVDLSLIPVLD